MVKKTKRNWQFLWRYQPPPKTLEKLNEDHGRRSSVKNNSSFSRLADTAVPKEETSKVAGDQGTDVKFSTDQILMIPSRYVGVSFCLKGVL